MNIVFMAILALAADPAWLDTSATPTTRLFVRTVPRGATVTVDGKAVGKSDDIFQVLPGGHKITVELDGYAPETREIEIHEGRIARVRVELQKQAQVNARPIPQPDAGQGPTPENAPSGTPDPTQAIQDSARAEAASTFVSQGDFPASTQQAMLTVLRQHPTETRWSGRDGNTLFGVAVKRMPQTESRSRAVPAMLELVQMLAVHEVLKAKSLLDRYAAAGLTDATTLRQAVEAAAGQLQVTGRAKGVVHRAAVRNGFAAAYIIAEQSDLSAYLLQPAELEKVRAAYRDVMHRQARDLMARSSWADALLLWQHLHQRKLVSQQLYLDAARCFQRLGQAPDAHRVLTEAIETFAESGTAEFFEQAGDMALEIQTEPAETLAERAYQKAIDILRDTVSGPDVSGHKDAGNKNF
ncbi:MAG TPA: PEGA domain-containing protein [Candidatus Anammoximicrobium sp.]|nr:PEGA domain-containing protein [Candidatus Anammoximicrobium sp.]